MLVSLGIIAFIFIILTFATGFLKIWKKVESLTEIHKYLALLAIFSLVLHIMEKFIFSFECFLILLFLSLSIIASTTSLKRLKKYRIKIHVLFATITILLILWHVYLTYPYAVPYQISWVNETEIKLPEPTLKGGMSLEETLVERKSIRNYLDKDIPLEHLSQLLWAAQGVTREWGGRTAPSAGATYPLELYIEVRRVGGLVPGIYHYSPHEHSLHLVKLGDFSDELMLAALSQRWVKDASLNIVVTAEFSRTTNRYGERGRRYVYLEAGHAAQNIYLQAASLGLGCVVVGAFNDEAVQNVIGTPSSHEPIYVIPIGFPSSI